MLGYLSRTEHFSSGHRLHSPLLSDQENAQIYGKCNHGNGHGHNYVLDVTLKGPIDETTGMIMNITDLKAILAPVIQTLDHKNIDRDVPFFKTKPSTVENLTVYIWQELAPKLNGLLYEVQIRETVNNYAIYKGE
jgi:6-pyruvoyltetrahydropterin/6-carboxytetrahydropterin synthase